MREDILRESYGYNGPYLNEDYVMSNFVRSFVEDTKYFGDKTAELYEALFMLNGEAVFLQENMDLVEELLDGKNKPFLFENALNEKEIFRPDPLRTIGGVAALATAERERAALAARRAALPDLIRDAANAETPEKAIEMLRRAETPRLNVDLPEPTPRASAVPEVAPRQAPVLPRSGSTPAPAAAAAAKTGLGAKILSGIKNVFGKVKGFFTNGVTSIGSALKNGNFGSLLKIPLVQGALVAGGAVLAFKLIKKIFGKKIKPEQEKELKAQLERKAA